MSPNLKSKFNCRRKS